MPSYLLIRQIHLTCAFLAVGFFLLRGGLQLSRANWRARWPALRWMPHLNDAMLLGAGLGLMLSSAQYPDAGHPWLTGKLVLLLAYIVTGHQALRCDRSRAWSAGWFLVALACLAGILTLAMARSVLAQIPDDVCRGQRLAEDRTEAPLRGRAREILNPQEHERHPGI